MGKKTNASTTLFCFTPLVSLTTFFIEFSFALYVLYQYKATTFSKLCIGIFLMLGLFQLAEFMLCMAGGQEVWAKIGVASITLLPALGVHLVSKITRKSNWVPVGYIMGIGIVIVLLLDPTLNLSTACTGKFVELTTQNNIFDRIYSYYYLGFVLIGIEMLIRSLLNHKGDSKELFWMLVAYLTFVIPTALLYWLVATTRTGIASIMCGFAVFAAIILITKEVPRYYSLSGKTSKKKKRR